MDVLIGLAEIGWLNALTVIVLFFFAMREGYSFCLWIKTEILDKYHAKKNSNENTKEQFEELKEMNKKEDQEIAHLRQEVSELKEQQDHCKNIQRDYHMAIIRNTLYHVYNRCKKYGYIDQAAYETFQDLKKFYLENDGNSIFKHKIIPYIDSLTIKGIEFEEQQNPEEE